MMIDDIAALLEAASTALTIGGATGTLAKADMNDAMPDTVAVLYETAGTASQFAFSTSTGNIDEVFRHPSLQVLTRAVSYPDARTLAGTIYTALNGVRATVAGTVYEVVAVQTPFSVGRDGSDRFLVSCNYQMDIPV